MNRYKVTITGLLSFFPDQKLPETIVVEADSESQAIEIAKKRSTLDTIEDVKVEILEF